MFFIHSYPNFSFENYGFIKERITQNKIYCLQQTYRGYWRYIWWVNVYFIRYIQFLSLNMIVCMCMMILSTYLIKIYITFRTMIMDIFYNYLISVVFWLVFKICTIIFVKNFYNFHLNHLQWLSFFNVIHLRSVHVIMLYAIEAIVLHCTAFHFLYMPSFLFVCLF